jgi:two-component system CheB/CheR fusion protein
MTPSDGTHPALVVGIGASAGGLAAFKGFLSHTPADTDMAFVLASTAMT